MFVLGQSIYAFTSTGEYLRSFSHDYRVLFFADALYALNEAFVVRTISFGFGRGKSTDRDVARLVLITDSAAAMATPVRTTTLKHVTRTSTMMTPMAVQVPPAASPAGSLYRTVGDSLHIEEWTVDGQLRTRIVSSGKRIPTSNADYQAYIEATRRMYFAHPYLDDATARDKMRWVRRLPKKEVRPATSALLVSSRGDLLLSRFDRAAQPYATWDTTQQMPWVLLRDHQVASRMLLPLTFQPLLLEACTVTGVYVDADDEPSLRRYGIPASSRDDACDR